MYKTIQSIFSFSFPFPVPFLRVSAGLNFFVRFSPASKAENAANAESSFDNVVVENNPRSNREVCADRGMYLGG